MQIRRADGDTAEMEAELNELLERIFETKQEKRQNQIDEMRERLQKLEEETSRRGGDRAEIIEARLNDLLGKSNRHDW